MKSTIILLILIVTVNGNQAHRYHDFDEDNDMDDFKTNLNDMITAYEEYDKERNIEDAQYVIEEIKWIILADLDIQLKEIREKADVDRSLARHCNTAKSIAVVEIETEIFEEIQIAAIYVAEAGQGMSDKSFSLTPTILNSIKDIKTLVENCVADNKTKPLGCVYKQIMAKIAWLLLKCQHLGEEILTSVVHATAWTTKIQDNFASKKNAIIADYKKCVNQLKNNNIL